MIEHGPADLYALNDDGEFVHVGTVEGWEIKYVAGSFRLAPPEPSDVRPGLAPDNLADGGLGDLEPGS